MPDESLKARRTLRVLPLAFAETRPYRLRK